MVVRPLGVAHQLLDEMPEQNMRVFHGLWYIDNQNMHILMVFRSYCMVLQPVG